MNSMTPTLPLWGRAAVLGGGLTGLVAARVLADHFEQVTLVEQSAGLQRNGSGEEAHPPDVLLVRNQAYLEGLFPGLLDELHAAGAVSFNMGLHVEWCLFGRWRPRYRSRLEVTACSRALLESVLHRRVMMHPRLHLLRGSEAAGLIVEAEGTRARGVQLRASGGTEELPAALVVDARGRASEASAWLTSLGFAPPKQTVVSVRPCYATRVYRRPASSRQSSQMIYVQPAPPYSTQGAILLPFEANRVSLTLIDMAGGPLPADEQAFAAFLRALPTSRIADAIQGAEPLTPIHSYQCHEERISHFDRLPRYLERFVVLAEGMCSLNPAHGEDTAVAVAGGSVLDACLNEAREQHRGDLSGFARRFQRQLADALAGPYQMAVSEDRRWLWTPGEGQSDPSAHESVERYMAHLMTATLTNSRVLETFYRVQQMMDTPVAFFNPEIVLEVMGALPPVATHR